MKSPPSIPDVAPERRSASADRAWEAEAERIKRMSARERVELALELGRRFGAKRPDEREPKK